MKSKQKHRAFGTPRIFLFFPFLAALCALLFSVTQQATLQSIAGNNTDYCVQFLDVGQGDAALLSLGGEYVLIDAGTSEAGDTVVRALTAQGVTSLRAVIASHAHEDHIGGMAAVLRAFPTDIVYLSDATTNTSAFENLLQVISEKKISAVVPNPKDVLTVGGVDITFLWPQPAGTYSNLNNTSLIVRVDTQKERILFVGDAEEEELDALVDSGADVACDIYKVGHHGSSNSSTARFLQAAKPEVAVISYGKNNTYGHPHAQVLERLAEIGAQVETTAQDGTVTLALTPPNL